MLAQEKSKGCCVMPGGSPKATIVNVNANQGGQ